MTFVSRGLSGGGVYGSRLGELWAAGAAPGANRTAPAMYPGEVMVSLRPDARSSRTYEDPLVAATADPSTRNAIGVEFPSAGALLLLVTPRSTSRSCSVPLSTHPI